MPANLPPDYYAAERRFRAAKTETEKIEILKEMLAIMPKHKGTEHLQGDLKRKIAKLNVQAQKKQAKQKSAGLDHIPREGAGQAVLVGAPNTGKSTMITYLTHAKSEIADFPFSTYRPVCGMMPFEDINIQLVDLPPVSVTYQESWMFNIIRLADLVVLLADAGSDHPPEQLAHTAEILKTHQVILSAKGEKRPSGSTAVKPAIIVWNKIDRWPGDQRQLPASPLDQEIPVISVSIRKDIHVDAFKKMIFNCLDVIRVYTKIPGKSADYDKPYIVPAGTTVYDAASLIHKDIAESMKYARIWGSEKYEGQRVERDHVLEDKDMIEIHMR